ncbi:nucleotide sugar dehydrogenase [Exiguobacterium sp. TBG-PICH-001]|uniref:nucleotide sugar dehydrogenase n=1 Tax=Exiguobacterium abrahamii TaxID=2785532 RepID=UPI0018A72B31|nr:nucleotide sugar dehydrogenase [Exiguobacterium sp. TBG-PICH-001]MBF8151813.1 nucleotide sugar dehydrogenase [Exiguobacterium sp. TBG-PICH-001]
MNTLNNTSTVVPLLPAKDRSIGIVGLGYVGLPVAVEFGMSKQVVGFDINESRLNELKNGLDQTNEVESDYLKKSEVIYTNEISKLSECDFIIVAVPTPVDDSKKPDLTPLLKASETVGKALKKGTIVVYESTVYPGATEEECVPVLEKMSGLKSGEDFFVGYSPERINPGDKIHTFKSIIKVVSGQTPEVLEIVAEVYESVVEAGVHRAPSIKVAEAAKVIENSQRDINIAFMNELSIIFNKMNIETKDVLEAASTKWNFLNFSPGLVGGHCIGVDPYYLTHKAEQLGYRSQIILSGRRINDDMGKYVVENLVKKLIQQDVSVKDAKVGILGFTFKENCPDTRNTKVIDIVEELKEYGINPLISDPVADQSEAEHEYGISFVDLNYLKELDALIVAVSHDEFKCLNSKQLKEMYANENKTILIDIKSTIPSQVTKEMSGIVWSL